MIKHLVPHVGLKKRNMLMNNEDGWNTDHKRWLKRSLLTRGDHIKKNNNFNIFALSLACRESVVSIVVSEGPAVQGIYQQVIREFPELIGGSGSLWESKRRYDSVF